MPEEPTGKTGGSTFIQKKIGPLPLWAWVAVGASALGVLYIMRRQSSGVAAGTQAVGSAGLGVTQADPLTMQQLTQQLGNLTSTLQQQLTPGGGSPMPPVQVASLPWQGIIGPRPSNYNGIGVQYFSSNQDENSTIGYIPWNAFVDIIGKPVIGRMQQAYPGGPSSNIWYPVSWGGESGWINQLAFGGGFVNTPPASPQTVPAITNPAAGAGLNLSSMAQPGIPLH